ncbi:MAG: ATP-dependent DNA helicase [Bifidobacteriaceae bacterium]|jgi:ATP-dependent DNA helicase DinG|nr:ATP-dependent DNA helicase [Bifidobacteriaceae bacterium]
MEPEVVARTLDDAVRSLGGERRPGQTRMAQAIARALADGRHLLVQAGTGTGKSLGYLVPALLHAVHESEPVIVATATLVLQRQIMSRDLPAAAKAAQRELPRAPVAALLKGRGNYICRHKLTGAYGADEDDEILFSRVQASHRPISELAQEVQRLTEWAAETETGDRDDFPGGATPRAWRHVSVTAQQCVGQKCPLAESCFAELARVAASRADLVVTNHAMLAVHADRGGALPPYGALVVDEAHQLTQSLTSALTGTLTPSAVRAAARSARRLKVGDEGLAAAATLMDDAARLLSAALTSQLASSGGPGWTGSAVRPADAAGPPAAPGLTGTAGMDRLPGPAARGPAVPALTAEVTTAGLLKRLPQGLPPELAAAVEMTGAATRDMVSQVTSLRKESAAQQQSVQAALGEIIDLCARLAAPGDATPAEAAAKAPPGPRGAVGAGPAESAAGRPSRPAPGVSAPPGPTQVPGAGPAESAADRPSRPAPGMSAPPEALGSPGDVVAEPPGHRAIQPGDNAASEDRENSEAGAPEGAGVPRRRDVIWVASDAADEPSANAAPLDVSAAIACGLLAEASGVFTSATLALGGRMDSAAAAAGLAPGGWDGLDVGSPFNYPRQGILYVAADLPEPGRGADHRAAQHARLRELIGASGGGALGLFTSFAAAQTAADALRDEFDFPILLQGDKAISALVEEFIADPDACLFGVNTLWQGVDAPGRTCRLVTIDRLAFPRPDDPIYSARAEAASRAGRSGFMAVSAPRAALMLAQGAGRLIRSASDKGVVAVLDSRLATKRYREFLMAALPPMWRTRDTATVLAALRRLAAS